jgi:hypothetical protein
VHLRFGLSFGERCVHASLKGGACVSETEGHAFVVVILIIGHEGCLWGVQRVHLELILSRIGVHEAQSGES